MKPVVTLFLAAFCISHCLAQGKLQWAVNSTHLIYYDATTGPLAGTAVSSANMPAGVTLVADLYAGSVSSSLNLVSTTTFGATAGRFNSANVTFNNPFLPAGTTNWFQIQVRDSAYSNADLSASHGKYAGFSQIFSAELQASIYVPIYTATSPVYSTWDNGTFNMDFVSAGSRGAIAVGFPSFSPPNIIGQPLSRTVPLGSFVKFDVVAQGSAPLHHQWYYGTSQIPRATNTSLVISNAQVSQSGDYKAIVSNLYGSATSAVAVLSVLPPLDVRMVPAIGVYGTVGQSYRIEYKNISGPVLDWTPVVTLTVTNTGQLYFDVAAREAARIYRLVEVP
jgi:hypothetical protein